MIRLEQSKYRKLWKAIRNELSLEILDHGPIDEKLIDSATKRIIGAIKTMAFNNKIVEKKHIRDFGTIKAGLTIFDKHGSIIIMAVAKSYAMMRRPGCVPFVEYYADIPKKYHWGKPPNKMIDYTKGGNDNGD